MGRRILLAFCVAAPVFRSVGRDQMVRVVLSDLTSADRFGVSVSVATGYLLGG